MRLAMMASICAAMVPGPAGALDRAPDDRFDVWDGSCADTSHTAQGTTRTPYPCSALIHIAMAADPGHEQLIFVIRGDGGKQNGVMLSFGGRVDGEGVLRIERVQFTPGESTPIAAGSSCTMTREGEVLKHVVCSVTASDGSGRSAAIDFTATGKAELKRGD